MDRARGDARKDSDWNAAVFIEGDDRPREISIDLLMETGEHMQAFPFPIRHEKLDYSTCRNVRADGIAA